MSKNFKNIEGSFILPGLRFLTRFHYEYESKTIQVSFGLKDYVLRRTGTLKGGFEGENQDIKLAYDEYDEDVIWEDEKEKIVPVVNWFSYTSKYRLDVPIYDGTYKRTEELKVFLYRNLIEEMKVNIKKILFKPELYDYHATPPKTEVNLFHDIEEGSSWVYSEFFSEDDKGKINLEELLEHGFVYFPESNILELMEDNGADLEWVGMDAVEELAIYLKDLTTSISRWALESCSSENRGEISVTDMEKAIDFVTDLYDVKREAPRDDIIWSEIHEEFDKVISKLKTLLDELRERGANSRKIIELFQLLSAYSKLDGEYVGERLDDRQIQIQVKMDYGDKFWIKVQDGMCRFGRGNVVKEHAKELYEVTHTMDSIQKIINGSDDITRDSLSYVISDILEGLELRIEAMERESQEIHKNTALLIGEDFTRMQVLERMVKLRKFKILKCDSMSKAEEIIDDKLESIALILIDRKSFPDTADLFYKALKRDSKLKSISITLFDS